MKKIRIQKDFWPFIESVIIVGTETDTQHPNFLTCHGIAGSIKNRHNGE